MMSLPQKSNNQQQLDEKRKLRAAEYYFNKINATALKEFEEFETQYNLVLEEDINTLKVHSASRCNKTYCDCFENGDSWRLFINYYDIASSVKHYPEDHNRYLNVDYCLCSTINCSCFYSIERTQAHLYTLIKWYNSIDTIFHYRIFRSIKAIDNLNNDVNKYFYKALRNYISKNLEEIVVYKDFIRKLKLEYISLRKPNLGYIPDLIMSQRPDLLTPKKTLELVAQINERPAMRQCISDRIDELILRLDHLDAQSLFTVKHEHVIDESVSTSIMSILGDLKESVQDILITTFKFTTLTIATVLYIILAYVIMTRLLELKPRYIIAIHLLLSLILIYVEEQGGPIALFSWCKNKLTTIKDRLVSEDGYVNTNILSFLPLFMINSMQVPAEIANKIITSKFLDSLGRKLSYLGDTKFFTGINTVTDWVKSGYEIIKKHFCTWIGVEYIPTLNNEQDAVTEWSTKCEKVFSEYNNRELLYSESTRSYLSSLYLEGCRFARHPIYKALAVSILQSCRNILIIIDKINSKLNVNGSLRNPPVTLMLYGDTGAGKSSLTLPLSVAILKEIYKREKNIALLEQLKTSWQTLIYPRNSEQEFWDGYTGQKVCIFDDWNQLVDSASNPSMELFELIRASNVFPYPLHMAHLEDKSSVNFCSDVIICSSNNRQPKVESLNFPQALIRRFTRFVTVERKKTSRDFNFDDYIITPYDENRNKDPLTVDQFVLEVVDDYIKNKSFVTSINSFVASQILNFDSTELVNDNISMLDAQINEKLLIQPPISTVSILNLKEKLKPFIEPVIQETEIVSSIPMVESFRSRINLNDSRQIAPFVSDCTQNIRKLHGELGIFDRLKKFSDKYSFINNNLTYILGAIGLIAGGIYLYKVFNRQNNNKAESIDKLDSYVRERINTRRDVSEAYEVNPKAVRVTEDFESYNVTIKTAKATEDINLKQEEAYESLPRPIKVTEACVDTVATEMGSSLARGNLYRVYCEHDEVEISLGHCLFLVSDIAIMPKHFVMTLEVMNNPIVYFASPLVNKCYPIRFKDLVFNEYKDKYGNFKDLVSFRVPGARQHSDIRSKFAPSSTLNAVGNTQICLITINCSSPKHPLILDRKHGRGVSCLKRVVSDKYTLSAIKAPLIVHDAWEYTTLETQKGDCGAPLLATNERIAPGKIIGIHVAGGIGVGVSTAIFKEDIDLICGQYTKYAQLNTFSVKPGENPYKECELLFLGKLDNPVIQPAISKIVPSLVHKEVTEPKTAKTWLRPGIIDGKVFDPLEYRTRRMGKPSVPIPLDLVNISKGAVLREFKRVYLKFQDTLSNRFKCPYSFKETCVGVPGEEFVNAVKRDTSCGFPFVQEGITRKMIFGNEDEYDVETEGAKLLEQLIEFYDKSALDGLIFDHYFTDTLKDERKPKHKAHKTRMFAACPIDYLLWCKKWFNGVVAIISELRNRIHVSVGTNVYSTDWHNMAEQLLRKSKYFVAGDFEGFDASQQAPLLQAACWILIEFNQFIFGENPQAKTIMWAIVYGLFNSFHVSGDNVFQWLKSLPSGHYLTAIINSIFVILVLNVSFLMANTLQGILPSDQIADDFFRYNDLVVYGDDHCIAISDKYISFYNQNTLVELLLNLGLYYTDELKTGSEVPDYRSLEEISFLKRKFFYNQEIARWVAPLDLDVILETPMWVRKCPDMELQTFNNIEFSLRELSLHSDDIWNEWAPKLLKLCETRCRKVSVFSNKNETLLFTLNTILAQTSDVIFDEKENMQGPNLRQLLSGEKAVGIYPYHTGSAQAAPKYPVNLARPRRLGDLEAEVNAPATTENFSFQTEEVKDVKYQEQTANDEVAQITTFENDMSIASQDVPMPVPMDLGLRSMHTDNAHHTIASFLKRPMILREFVWDSSKTRGKDIFDKIKIPFDMLVRQFKDKLQGFTSFRATAVINVQFQTQPFQAGRCIIAAVPLPYLIGKRVKIIEDRISNLTLLNHVQADIAKQTEVILRVPYVSPLIAYDLVQGCYNWAEVVGKVYSPVTSVGTTKIEGIVYVHFEDIQLGAPTSMSIFSDMKEAQSGDAKMNNKKIPFEPEVLSDIRQRAQEVGITTSNTSRITGGVRKLNNTISDYITPLKPVTDALDKYLLKPIDDFVGPILGIFGFSKPITIGDDKLLRPTTNFATLHGTDRALTLATSDDINAPFLPHLNGSQLDEMSFDYLKKIPQFIDYFSYSTVNNRNDILYTFYVRPTFKVLEQLKFTFKNTSKVINQPSHLAYITEPFLYWTGSIVLTLKFVKTDYHSGRVEITYHPNCNPCSDTRKVKSNVDFDMAYRYIVDLREKNEVSLRIPYIAVTPFKRNVSTLVGPSETVLAAIENNSGVVVVRALTPLKASNAVVSNTIEVLVEYNAGNDFQVMNPVTCRYNPFTPLEKASTTVFRSMLEAQSGEASVAGLAITRQQAIEGEDPPSITNNLGEIRADSSAFAVTGEKFTNFRDLCHRTNFVIRVEQQSSFSQSLHRFYIPPPISRPDTTSGELPGFYFLYRGNSTLGYIGAMYALCRGSVNVRVQPDQYEGYIGAKLFSQQSQISDCLFPRAIEKSSIKGLAEFHVPYYCRTYQFDHLKYDSSSLYDLEFSIAVPRSIKVTASAAVSGGDDISFGYFVGTPIALYPEIVLSTGGADPFDSFKVETTSAAFICWDDIDVVAS